MSPRGLRAYPYGYEYEYSAGGMYVHTYIVLHTQAPEVKGGAVLYVPLSMRNMNFRATSESSIGHDTVRPAYVY